MSVCQAGGRVGPVLAVFLLVTALVGCGGDDSKVDPTTTTTEQTTSTIAELVATSTSTAQVPSSTSTTHVEEEAGGEAITVTEQITITIADPEDG